MLYHGCEIRLRYGRAIIQTSQPALWQPYCLRMNLLTTGLGAMRKLLKTLGVVGLSGVIAYTGVAWAFFECLNGMAETAHARASGEILTSELSRQNIDFVSCGPSQVKLHCPPSHHEFDAVAQDSPKASLSQIRKLSELKIFLFAGELTSLREIETAWRGSPSVWIISSATPKIPSRHLLLSVFLI